MGMRFVQKMKLILLLLSLTISTIPASANQTTREQVRYYKSRCIVRVIEAESFYDKLVFVKDVLAKCSCEANNISQGLDIDECKVPRTLGTANAKKHFSWD